tara:strand:- start:224 stop:442 length:219 start_codon:yes stop_codon:yes gene_type:complete
MKPKIASLSNGYLILCFEDNGATCGADAVTQDFAESVVKSIRVPGAAAPAPEATTTTTTKKQTKKKKAAAAE